MEYRRLGRTGFNVSAVSLGTEYLIDLPREHVVSVVAEAVARGVNYFDLFFAQPEFRDNMGAAFAARRDKVHLAGHLGATDTDGQSDKTRDPALAEEFILDFFIRYNTDHVDVLFIHNCDGAADYDEVMRPGGLADLAARLQKEGKARAIGFSTHTVSTALDAVRTGRIDVLMFPLNLAANAVEGRSNLLNACVAHDVGLVAMKPYAGGKLLQQDARISVDEFLLGDESGRTLEKSSPVTPVNCLAYVLAQPGVSTVVPGCKDLSELAQALAYLDATQEQKDFSNVITDFKHYVAGECVYCNHCLPCPSHIDIGQTIRLADMARRHTTPEITAAYETMPANASDCIQCGQCTERCPFGVDVIPIMAAAARLFS